MTGTLLDKTTTQLDELSVNTIRFLAVDAVQKANSGHPGLPMGAAPMAYIIWTKFLRHNPHNPKWFNRDRFVLSAGHGSMLLYALLHLTGYDLGLEDLKHFRQLHSRTPGHPENFQTPGVEVTTGPLGQGLGNGIGLAIAEEHLAARYNKPGHQIIDHYTYAIVSDGDLMEGVASEAASLGGHLGLGKVIYLYDDNHISIDGETELSFTEDRMKRFEAYGWHTQHVTDGNDLVAIEEAVHAARAVTDRPSIIAVRTIIGYGSPNKANSHDVHGSPLGPDEVKATKLNLKWPLEPDFYIPDDVLAHFRQAVDNGAKAEAEWHERFAAYKAEFPAEAAELEGLISGTLPEGWEQALPTFSPTDKPIATRAASGKVLGAVTAVLPGLIGGSADLAPSNNTYVKAFKDFQKDTPYGRNFHFGVREHGMGAVMNGMALHGGLKVYGGTFLIFMDYMKGAVRVAALSHSPVVYVYTHDSIGLGEDGPTHQPVEQLITLRATPNLTVIRPADGTETAGAWKIAIESKSTPVALILTRQNLPIQPTSSIEGVAKGGYTLVEAENPDLILIGTGSEVFLVVDAQKKLAEQGVAAKVVSLPSWELFEQQPQAYKDSVLNPGVKRLAVEAGSTFGWHKYTGLDGDVIGIDTYGASAPIKDVMPAFGFTVENVTARALKLLGK
ncbi:transketolase [Gloeobacter kilaueensis]|uniref:Transketolase n=1 Tax=Gloeobacter kilaueensis (strain ATCC BAA-2537 / CCAP 1431/1 / ULC 316 / JS1) TaxID=1183438 RepID=U5QBI7_GLOK1|nr:transketolase [Gloeobacter kilaueensis]AGY56262.1 transketolase [Gloeobacter kilaueensis JS1]